MKPICQLEKGRFPKTDCFFQAYDGRWHGWGDDQSSPRPPNLGREYLVKSARDRAKEMIMLAILLLAAAWPTVLVIVEVLRAHSRH